MERKMIKGYIFSILSAVIYGCMPLMAKFIYADGVNSISLVFLRNFLALPVLAALALTQQKTLKVTPKALPSIILIALFGCALTPILLFSSYNYIASGTATILHYVYPAMVVIGGVLFFKKKVPVGNIISVILCVAGIALFYDPTQPLDLTGCALALGSGITFAAYVLLLSNFRYKEITGFTFSFYIAAASAVITFIACIASGSLILPATLTGWLLCALFAVMITCGAVILFQQGAFIIGGEKTSILSTLEPITSIIVGVLVFHETLKINDIFGSVLVVLASILIAVFDMKKSKKEPIEAKE